MDIDIVFILTSLKGIGLTQSQIAAEIGCSQPTISDMAAGKVGATRPSFKVISGLQRLAEKHGIPTVAPVDQKPAQPAARRKDDPQPDATGEPDPSPSRKNMLECGINQPQLYTRK